MPSDILINSFLAGSLLLLGIIFLQQSITKKRKAYSLTIAIFLGVLATVIELIRHSFKGKYFYYNEIMLFFHIGTWAISYFLIFIFFQRLSSESYPTTIGSIVATLLAYNIIFGFLRIFKNLYVNTMEHTITFLWDFSYSALAIIIFIYGIVIHYKIYLKTKERRPRLFSYFLIFVALGFCIALMNDTISYIDALSSINRPKFLDYAALTSEILKLLGIFGFIITYISDINYIFRLPISISTIMVFNRYGMVIYAAKFLTEADYEKDRASKLPIELITASINAFETFIKETTNSKGGLKKVETEDKIVKIRSGDLATIAIIADKTTYFLDSSMKYLITIIEENFEESLKMDYTESSRFQEIPKYISMAFPYLPLPTAEEY